jgi:hypothetical protein
VTSAAGGGAVPVEHVVSLLRERRMLDVAVGTGGLGIEILAH